MRKKESKVKTETEREIKQKALERENERKCADEIKIEKDRTIPK